MTKKVRGNPTAESSQRSVRKEVIGSGFRLPSGNDSNAGLQECSKNINKLTNMVTQTIKQTKNGRTHEKIFSLDRTHEKIFSFDRTHDQTRKYSQTHDETLSVDRTHDQTPKHGRTYKKILSLIMNRIYD
jgi:hypothetical protein